MENSTTIKFKKGDYVNFRISEDKFRGRIKKLISETKEGKPTKALIEVSSSSKKSSEVNIAEMEVSLYKLSPLT